MDKEILDTWNNLAARSRTDVFDDLRAVLDPVDVKGVKNSYIDAYLKHYLLRYLRPGKGDVLLEVGCGPGRLTEYLSQFVRSVYGIDIIDTFIDDCGADPRKHNNTFYFHLAERDRLKVLAINKMYVVWVLMYLVEAAELVDTLSSYRKRLPNLRSAVFIEQVKKESQIVYRDGKVDCCYRTIDQYRDVFEAAGFQVKEVRILGERHNGVLYTLLHYAGGLLPRRMAAYAGALFAADRWLMERRDRSRLINTKRPTDVVFVLEAL